ncbi:MAG TPA: hypothetical protein VFR35_09775, partial [Actinoplanes sp.]|nr:hypothetical protein [Actinoplanes sp.]
MTVSFGSRGGGEAEHSRTGDRGHAARRGASGPDEIYVVLPGTVDDPANPSGGNRYDRAICDGLARSRSLHEIAVNGSWPRPSATVRTALASVLRDIPDKSTVLLDGLVACGIPDVLEPHARRLRLIVLVHLPLSDETGRSPAETGRSPAE